MFDQQEYLRPLNPLAFPLLMPLDPRRRVVSAVPEKATVFKSAMQPLGLSFTTAPAAIAGASAAAPPPPPSQAPEGNYAVIFKSGDDLRQDQLVLQVGRCSHLPDGLPRGLSRRRPCTAPRACSSLPPHLRRRPPPRLCRRPPPRLCRRPPPRLCRRPPACSACSAEPRLTRLPPPPPPPPLARRCSCSWTVSPDLALTSP